VFDLGIIWRRRHFFRSEGIARIRCRALLDRRPRRGMQMNNVGTCTPTSVCCAAPDPASMRVAWRPLTAVSTAELLRKAERSLYTTDLSSTRLRRTFLKSSCAVSLHSGTPFFVAKHYRVALRESPSCSSSNLSPLAGLTLVGFGVGRSMFEGGP